MSVEINTPAAFQIEIKVQPPRPIEVKRVGVQGVPGIVTPELQALADAAAGAAISASSSATTATNQATYASASATAAAGSASDAAASVANSMDKPTYDPNAISADAFDMASMIEATDAKIMTAAERTKLSGIAAGAEVNVNPDWDAASGDAEIQNKPTLGTSAALDVGTTAGTVAAGDDARLSSNTAFVVDRTAMAALNTTARKSSVLVGEGGRNGLFTWNASSLSALVTIDTRQGIYVPPSSDTTGASGAWVRQRDDIKLALSWFGADGSAADNTAAIQGALTLLQNGFGGVGWIDHDGRYVVKGNLTYSGSGLSIIGRGRAASAFIADGVPTDTYLLSATGLDYTTPVQMRDFQILTRDDATSNPLNIEFTLFDSVFNRVPHRCELANIDIRSEMLDSFGWCQSGFRRGVRVFGAIAPMLYHVTVSGKQIGMNEAQNASMAVGFEFVSDQSGTGGLYAAPTDPVMRDCYVVSAADAITFTGHWEGMIIDHCVGVLCNRGVVATASGPVPSFPWLHVVNSHFNTYDSNIVVNGYFDVKIHNNLLYKFSFNTSYTCSITSGSTTVTVGGSATTKGMMTGMPVKGTGIPVAATIASVTDATHFVLSAAATATNASAVLTMSIVNTSSVAMQLTGAPRATITGNTFNNLTKDDQTNVQYNGILLTDTNDSFAADNLFSGVTDKYSLVGTSARNTYRRGQIVDEPSFTTNREFVDLSSGAGNIQRGVEFVATGSTVSGGAIFGASPVDLLYVSPPGALQAGDVIYVSAQATITKDTNAGLVSLSVGKNIGTATVEFEDALSEMSDTKYMPASAVMNFRVSGFMTVLTSGSFQWAVRGLCDPNGATTAAGGVQMKASRL